MSVVNNVWSESALVYADLLNHIYGSFILLAALMAFVLQSNLKKYKTLIIASSFWALFHAILLLFLIWTNNYQQIFRDLPSLLVWLPFYKEYLTFNSLALLTYSAIVFLWMRSKSGQD